MSWMQNLQGLFPASPINRTGPGLMDWLRRQRLQQPVESPVELPTYHETAGVTASLPEDTPDIYSTAMQYGQQLQPEPERARLFGADSPWANRHSKLAAMLQGAVQGGALTAGAKTGSVAGDVLTGLSSLMGLRAQEREQAAALPMQQFKTGLGAYKGVSDIEASRAEIDAARQKMTLEQKLAPFEIGKTRAEMDAANALATQRGFIETSPGATLVPVEGLNSPYTAPTAVKTSEPSRTTAIRPDAQSRTGYAEFTVGLDPLTGKELWAQRVGEATKPGDGLSSESISPTAGANLLMRLSGQWTALTKEIREMQRQSTMMDTGLRAARTGNTAAGAQAVLVTFQKILDPTSVVRESEYARSGEGQSLLNRIQGAYEKLAYGGAGVPVSELEKFATLAKEFVTRASSADNLVNEQHRLTGIAQTYGINPQHIFGPAPITGSTPAMTGSSVTDALKAIFGDE